MKKKRGIDKRDLARVDLAAKSQPKPSALRKALGELHRAPMLEPHQIPVQAILWRILIQPLPPLQRNAGGVIELPDQVQNADATLTAIGRVLQLGHFAFKSTTQAGLALSEEPFKPKVGDYVLHETYAGQEIRLRDGMKLRMLLDTEILAIVKDPDEIKNYI